MKNLENNKKQESNEPKEKKQRGRQTENNSVIGAALKALRTSKDLRQQDLALAVCVFNQIHIREGMTLKSRKIEKVCT